MSLDFIIVRNYCNDVHYVLDKISINKTNLFKMSMHYSLYHENCMLVLHFLKFRQRIEFIFNNKKPVQDVVSDINRKLFDVFKNFKWQDDIQFFYRKESDAFLMVLKSDNVTSYFSYNLYKLLKIDWVDSVRLWIWPDKYVFNGVKIKALPGKILHAQSIEPLKWFIEPSILSLNCVNNINSVIFKYNFFYHNLDLISLDFHISKYLSNLTFNHFLNLKFILQSDIDTEILDLKINYIFTMDICKFKHSQIMLQFSSNDEIVFFRNNPFSFTNKIPVSVVSNKDLTRCQIAVYSIAFPRKLLQKNETEILLKVGCSVAVNQVYGSKLENYILSIPLTDEERKFDSVSSKDYFIYTAPNLLFVPIQFQFFDMIHTTFWFQTSDNFSLSSQEKKLISYITYVIRME